MKDRLDEFRQETEKNLGHQSEVINQERQTRTNENKNILDKLKIAQTEDLHVSAMGLVWLVFGLIMSTASIELAGCVVAPDIPDRVMLLGWHG